MKSIINYAHRGASDYRPENTKVSFDYAIELKANGIETDVQRTKDGVLVLFHDDTIDRKSNSTGRIVDYTYNQLMAMDFGGWYDLSYLGTRIVTFEEFAKAYFHLDMSFAIELKAPDCEQGVIDTINAYNARDKVIITSFQYSYLAKMRSIDSTIRLGWLVDRINQENIDNLKLIGGYQICPEAFNTDADDVALAKRNGLTTRVWGVYDKRIMVKALQLEIEGMTVNFPDLLYAEITKE